MDAKLDTHKFRSGASLIDVTVAIVVLTIAAIGTSNYRYYCTMDSRRADMRIAAAQAGNLLCENWKGIKGDQSYDPVTQLGGELTITKSNGPKEPEGFNRIESYRIELNGDSYYTTLAYKDIYGGLRALNVVVSWSPRDFEGVYVDGDESYQLFRLTSYVSTSD